MHVPNSSRRSFMKWAAAAPLLSQIAVSDLYAKAATAVGKDPRQNCYTRLGVKTVINCRGTWTYLSGSLEFPEVREAQIEAAQHFVNVLDLQRAIGRRLAELTGAESGMITSGAAGAMAVSTAGCMAGTDDKLIWQLPDTTGLKNEVIMSGGRSAFDSAVRLTGAKLVLAFSPEELANAINSNTAMIYTTHLGDELQKELAIAKDHKVPMLLDDAAGIPPADNAKLYAQDGNRSLHFFRRKRPVRAPVQRRASGPKRSDRGGHHEQQPARGSGVPSHEGGKRRNDRLPHRHRNLAEAWTKRNSTASGTIVWIASGSWSIRCPECRRASTFRMTGTATPR